MNKMNEIARYRLTEDISEIFGTLPIWGIWIAPNLVCRYPFVG